MRGGEANNIGCICNASNHKNIRSKNRTKVIIIMMVMVFYTQSQSVVWRWRSILLEKHTCTQYSPGSIRDLTLKCVELVFWWILWLATCFAFSRYDTLKLLKKQTFYSYTTRRTLHMNGGVGVLTDITFTLRACVSHHLLCSNMGHTIASLLLVFLRCSMQWSGASM